MPNYELDPDFIQSQYLAGPNQTEFQTVAAVPEVADSGVSTEASRQTNPILIETIERSRTNRKNYEYYGEDEFDA